MQGAQAQEKYWSLLKSSKWNEARDAMPRYSVLETILVDNPDFDSLDSLTQEIEAKAMSEVDTIIIYLQTME